MIEQHGPYKKSVVSLNHNKSLHEKITSESLVSLVQFEGYGYWYFTTFS